MGSPRPQALRRDTTEGGETRRGMEPAMSMPMVTSNTLLGLVAAVGVTSTLLPSLSLLWVPRRRKNLPDYTPPVTIFKPLKGVDEDLEANLRTFFELDYPAYQL